MLKESVPERIWRTSILVEPGHPENKDLTLEKLMTKTEEVKAAKRALKLATCY